MLPIAVSHGEGRAEFASETQAQACVSSGLVAFRYVTPQRLPAATSVVKAPTYRLDDVPRRGLEPQGSSSGTRNSYSRGWSRASASGLIRIYAFKQPAGCLTRFSRSLREAEPVPAGGRFSLGCHE